MLYPCQLRVVPFGNNAATQFWGYNISTVIVASLVTLDIGQRGLLLAQLLLALPDDPPSHPTGLRDRQREREREADTKILQRLWIDPTVRLTMLATAQKG
ncbi:hypothetical protein ASPWEDRAFT_34758 [Aspergillus wentii DTO 134E9]|uniref:Uncharacterized protein n=1 Tax=Aspergillus wentii DTO 134E9 TaxID=1073089 RepID=A0A1L9S255_ASPWE|nr:uncharacterized protein ASPWEDRAFT_34758 [Aspergillus wentii DTO 134E9]OJJ41246.1 hypothetical protein ASPWEDRAFT_34758 [Aspergillus wentii DTO 134E9]